MAVISRVAARSCRHNHHTTSWFVIGSAVVVKKLFARFIIGSITSIEMTILTSVFLAILELFMRVTMPLRDGFMYRRVFGSYLDYDLNAVALMTNVRSRGLR